MKTKNYNRVLVILLSAAVCVSFVSGANADETKRYTTHIKPIFDRKCIVCHGAGSPEYKEFKKDKKKYKAMSKGPRMDSYPYLIYFVGWPDTGALMRRLDDGSHTKDRQPGNMFRYLGDNESERQENLNIFKEWVGNWSLKRWRSVTKEEMDKITIKY